MAGYEVKESKTIQTYNNPAMIDAVNQKYETFMWSVLNVQITHVKDSHLEFEDRQCGIINDRIETVVKSVTEETQYATITYERNKLIPHYEEIIAIEQVFLRIEKEIEQATKERDISTFIEVRFWITGLWVLFGGMMGFSLITGRGTTHALFKMGLVGMVISLIMGGAFYVFDWIKGRMEWQRINSIINNKLMPKRNAVMEEMQQLGRVIMEEMRVRS